MIFRDIVAAILVTAGIGSVAAGAGMVTPAAGWIALGAQLPALGVALGVGEVGARAAKPEGEAAAPEPVAARLRYVEGAPIEDDAAPETPRRPRPSPPTGPNEAVVPMSHYIGVRGVAPSAREEDRP